MVERNDCRAWASRSYSATRGFSSSFSWQPPSDVNLKDVCMNCNRLLDATRDTAYPFPSMLSKSPHISGSPLARANNSILGKLRPSAMVLCLTSFRTTLLFVLSLVYQLLRIVGWRCDDWYVCQQPGSLMSLLFKISYFGSSQYICTQNSKIKCSTHVGHLIYVYSVNFVRMWLYGSRPAFAG